MTRYHEEHLIHDHERQKAQKELERGRVDGQDPEAEEHDGGREVDQRCVAAEIAPHRGKIHQPLRHTQAALQQRILAQQHLHRSLRPTQALREHRAEVFWSEADRKLFVVVHTGPAERVQAHRGRHIFGHRDGGQRHERLGLFAAVHVEGAQQGPHALDGAERRELPSGQRSDRLVDVLRARARGVCRLGSRRLRRGLGRRRLEVGDLGEIQRQQVQVHGHELAGNSA